MRISEIISRAFGLIVLAALLCWVTDASGQATDTFTAACAGQDACQLNQNGPVSWAAGNQVWRFAAKYPSESIRIWILNQNPTSAHTSQAVQVFVTDDSSAPSLLQNADRWVQAAVTDNSVANAKCTSLAANAPTSAPGANGKGTCYTIGMFANQIAIRITGAVAQAGNPDTFNIGIVQQPSTYPGGAQPGQDSTTGVGGSTPADATQNANIPGVQSFGMLFNGTTWDRMHEGNDSATANLTGSIKVAPVFIDPCLSSSVLKNSIPINITSATTTALVAPAGSSTTFVCGFDFTISQVVTTANTLQFETGTGAACAGSTAAKTGLYGAGGVTAGIPIHISSVGNGTIFQSTPSGGVCAVTAIGASGSFQGILTFVQQ